MAFHHSDISAPSRGKPRRLDQVIASVLACVLLFLGTPITEARAYPDDSQEAAISSGSAENLSGQGEVADNGEASDSTPEPATIPEKTIVLDANRGTLPDNVSVSGEEARISMSYGTPAVQLPQPYSVEGYRLAGWSTTPTGERILDDPDTPQDENMVALFVPDGQEIEDFGYSYEVADENGPKTINADLTVCCRGDEIRLYAQWSALASPADDMPEVKSAPDDDDDGKLARSDPSSPEPLSYDDGEVVLSYQPAGDDGIEAISVGGIDADLEALSGDKGAEALEGAKSELSNAFSATVKGKLGQEPEKSDELAGILADARIKTSANRSAGDGLPTSAGGNSIDAISATWVTSDTVDDGGPYNLCVTPTSSIVPHLVLRVAYSLSGEKDYMPGDIVITIPAATFFNRSGRAVGDLTIPYPEEPRQRGDYNWKQVDDEIVLTNTNRLRAATQGFFELGFSMLPTDLMQDMYPFEWTGAKIEITTSGGTLIGRTSNSLTAQIDTYADLGDVTNEKAENAFSLVPAADVPSDCLIGEETSYLRVDWVMTAKASGTQPYNLDVEDELVDEYLHAIPGHGEDMAKNLSSIASFSSSQGPYVHQQAVYYPLSQFELGSTYIFVNNAKFILTEFDPAVPGDPQEVRIKESEATATWTYRKPSFEEPGELLKINKVGNDGNGWTGKISSLYQDWQSHEAHIRRMLDRYVFEPKYLKYEWYGVYPSILNQLRRGQDAEISYTIQAIGHVLPLTYEEHYPGTGEIPAVQIEGNYNRKPVKIESTDTGLRGLVAGADYTFSGVDFSLSPTLLKSQPVNLLPDGSFESAVVNSATFGYQRDSYSNMPIIEVWIERAGAWAKYAEVDYAPRGAASITLSGSGAPVSGSLLELPDGATGLRCSTTMTNAGIEFFYRPIIKLRASSPLLQAKTAYILDSGFDMSFDQYNDARLDIWTWDDEGGEVLAGSDSDSAFDKLMGYDTEVDIMPIKKGEQIHVDFEEETIIVKYTTSIQERTTITNRDSYIQAVEDGAISSETQGTFYDLLPKGASPILSSIELRENDTIQQVYTIEDYKNSGRTLLVVKAQLAFTPEEFNQEPFFWYDVPTLSFNVSYPIINMLNYGNSIHNVIAFESSHDHIGTVTGRTGEPDNPRAGNNSMTAWAFADDDEKTWMTDLNPNRDDPAFVYAGVSTTVSSLTQGITSLSKDVDVNNEGSFSRGVYDNQPQEAPEGNARMVYAGGMYTYRLVATSLAETSSKDIVFYDSLEDYRPHPGNDAVDFIVGDAVYANIEAFNASHHPDEYAYVIIDADGQVTNRDYPSEAGDTVHGVKEAPRWSGTLRKVDVSQLEKKGVKPVVYYSTENLIIADESGTPVNTLSANPQAWVPATSYTGDIADVKAIAIDATQTVGAEPFELEEGEYISVLIQMSSPGDEDAAEAIQTQAHAYNNVFMEATSVDADSGEAHHGILHNEYTKVGIKEMSLNVTKLWDDDGGRDLPRPQNTVVRLYRDGIDTGRTVTLNEGNSWTQSFDDLDYFNDDGSKVIYSFVEEAVPEGYTVAYRYSATGVTIINRHVPETTTIAGTKVWVGDEEVADTVRPSSVIVKLYADGDEVATTVVTAEDNWNYSFGEQPRYRDGGIEIEYTVKEVKVAGDHSDILYVMSLGDGQIINTYHPYGDLMITNEIKDATSAVGDVDFVFKLWFSSGVNHRPVFDEYSYEVLDESDEIIGTGTVSSGSQIILKDGQRAVIKEIPQGISCSVTQIPRDEFTTTSTGGFSVIVPNETKVASFTNIYVTSGLAQISGSKVLEGRDLERYQFSFGLYDVTGLSALEAADRDSGVLVRTGSNGAGNAVLFGALRYSNADDGKVFRYRIQENDMGKGGYTYDDSVYFATVAVADQGDGSMACTVTYEDQMPVFENSYHAEGSIVLQARKELVGGDVSDYSFTFELDAVDADGELLTGDEALHQQKQNDEHGLITWDEIQYTEADANKTFYYRVREVAGNDPHITYDSSEQIYAVQVKDDGLGHLQCVSGNAEPIYAGVPDEVSDYKYAVSVWGIEVDVDMDGNPMGITFGPALGPDYRNSYKSHEPSGTTDSGYAHRCIHNDRWSTIAQWNDKDPYVYEQCIEHGCTKSVPLNSTGTNPLFDEDYSYSFDGDGVSSIYDEILVSSAGTDAQKYVNVHRGSGTWNECRLRAMLNGADDETLSGSYAGVNSIDYVGGNTLFAAFPSILRSTIGLRETVYQDRRSLSSSSPCYDRLWISSANEVGVPYRDWNWHRGEGEPYPYVNARQASDLQGWPAYYASGAETSGHQMWTRSINSNDDQQSFLSYLYLVAPKAATTEYGKMEGENAGIAPVFALQRHYDSYIDFGNEIVDWAIEQANPPVFRNRLKDGSIKLGKNVDPIGTPGYSADQVFRFKMELGEEYDEERLTSETVTKISKTSNINDNGQATGSVQYSALNKTDTVTIEGASSLTIDVWVSTYTLDYSWLAIYGKDQTPSNSNFDTAEISHGKLGGGANSYSYDRPATCRTYVVNGDTAKFYFGSPYPNYASARYGYGYYAVVKGTVPSTETVHHDMRVDISPEDAVFSPTSGTVTGDPSLNSIVQTSTGCYDIDLCLGYQLSIPDVPAGTPYKIYEQTPAGWVLVEQNGNVGSIESLEESNVMFTNKYSPGSTSAVISASKFFDGRPCQGGEFSFELWEGNSKLQTKPTLAGGAIVFDPIEYSVPGQHTYTIKEVAGNESTIVYDDHEETVIVDVSAQGGLLEAQVSYDADNAVFSNETRPGTLKVSVEAVNAGSTSRNDTFDVYVILREPAGKSIRDRRWISVYDEDGTLVKSYVSEVPSWQGYVIPLHPGEYFEMADVPANSYYEVSESEPPAGWELTSATGGQGQISSGEVSEASFVNTYSMFGQVMFDFTKRATGFLLTEGAFEFELRDSEGMLLQRTRNGAVGDNGLAPVEFDSISYDAEGTYTYSASEVEGDSDYIEYDLHPIAATVEVHDIGGGCLQCDVRYANGDSMFWNRSKIPDVGGDAGLSVTKTAVGTSEASGQNAFTFDIDIPIENGTFPARVTGTDDIVAEYTGSSAEPQGSQDMAKVTFDANGGDFDDAHAQKNMMAFSSELVDRTLTLHTPNISDDGAHIGGYFNSSTIGPYSEEGTVPMPGANAMHVELSFSGVFEDADGYDFYCSHWASGGQFGTDSFDVYDSHFSYTYSTEDTRDAYGYYAVVTGRGYNALGEYMVPSNEDPNCHFAGWYTTPECSDGTEFDLASYDPGQGDVTVYAKWVDYSNYSIIVKTDNIDDDGTQLSPGPSRDGDSVELSIPGALGLHIDMIYSGWMEAYDGNGNFYDLPSEYDDGETLHKSFDVLGCDSFHFYSYGGQDYGYYIVATPYTEESISRTFIWHTDNLSDNGEELSSIEYAGDWSEWLAYIPSMTSMHVSVTYSGSFYYYLNNGDAVYLPQSSSADEVLHEEFDLVGNNISFCFRTLYDDSYGCYLTFTPILDDGSESYNEYFNICDGSGTVTLRPGETITIGNLPDDLEYAVSERDGNAGWTQIAVENDTGQLVAGEIADVTFTNRYSSTGTWRPLASKTLVVANEETIPAPGAFSFVLLDGDNSMVSRGSNDANGDIGFSDVVYSLADDGVEHVYTMREIAGNDPDISYDQSEVTVTVTPHDDGQGNMLCDVEYAGNPDTGPTFRNTKNAETTSLYVYKSWQLNGEMSTWPANATVEVELLQTIGAGEPTVVDTLVLSSSQPTYTFPALATEDTVTGDPISYSVRESATHSVIGVVTPSETYVGAQGRTHIWSIDNSVSRLVDLPSAGLTPGLVFTLLGTTGISLVVGGAFWVLGNRRRRKTDAVKDLLKRDF